MRALSLIALALPLFAGGASACDVQAEGYPGASDAQSIEIPRSDLRAGTVSDLRYAERELSGHAARVATRSPTDQEALAAAHRVLVENCPYRRAAVSTTLALREAMAESFALAADPAFAEAAPTLARRLQALDAATAAHVSLLRDLGVADLEPPPAGSYLDGRLPEGELDSMGYAMAALEDTRELVNRMDGATKQALDDATAKAEALAGFRLELKADVISYSDAAEAVSDRAAALAPTGAATATALTRIRDEAAAAVSLTEALIGLYC